MLKLLETKRTASYPASGSKRWLRCPGSVVLSRWIQPPPSSIWAKEGTAAHYLAERALASGISPDRYIGNILHVTGQYHDPFTFTVTEDMAFAVAVYFQFIRSLENRHKASRVYLEQKVSLKHISSKLRGTADCIIKQPKALIVADYKHGKGIPVSIENNPQIAFYALGALAKFGRKFDRLELYIIQPRIWGQDPLQKWIVDDVKGFWIYWTRTFKRGFERASRPSKLDPIERYTLSDECRWCNGLIICPAVQSEALMFAERSVRDMQKLSLHSISEVLRKKNAIAAYIRAVEEFAKELALTGTTIPHHKLVATGRSNRAWADSKEVEEYLLDECLLDEDDIFDRKLKSPAQIEKLNDIDKDELAEYVAKSKSFNYAVVPESDSRQAVKSATDDFADDFDDDDIFG